MSHTRLPLEEKVDGDTKKCEIEQDGQEDKRILVTRERVVVERNL